MKHIEKFLAMLFNMKWYVNFGIWFTFIFILFLSVFSQMTIEESMFTRMIVFSASLALILAALFTFINVAAKKARKFYQDMDVLRKAAKNAIALEELRKIRKDVISLWQTRMDSHNRDITNETLQLIDNRLQYEFKVLA